MNLDWLWVSCTDDAENPLAGRDGRQIVVSVLLERCLVHVRITLFHVLISSSSIDGRGEEKRREKKSNWEFSENLLRFFLAFYFSKFFFLSCGLNQKQPQMKWVYFYDYTMMNHSRIVYSRNKDKKKKVFPPLQLLNQFMWFWFSKGEGTWGRGGGGVALPQTDNYMNLPPILGRCHLCLSSTPPPPRIQGCRWSLCGGGGAGC